MSFLDVGQGDATLIQLGATSVLVDTGPPDGPILERLQQADVKRLDALFLTHAEADHEGAALAVIAAYAPRLVVDGGAGWDSAVQRALPAALAAKRSRAVAPQAGRRIDVGALRFTSCGRSRTTRRPAATPTTTRSSRASTHGHFSMLLTADAESHVTDPLDLEPVDVLKVAHHGSADPGLPALLKRLTAAGRRDRGRPRQHATATPRRARSRRSANGPAGRAHRRGRNGSAAGRRRPAAGAAMSPSADTARTAAAAAPCTATVTEPSPIRPEQRYGSRPSLSDSLAERTPEP